MSAPDTLDVRHNLACGDSWWKGEACYHGTPAPDSAARFHEKNLLAAITSLVKAAGRK